MFVKYLNPVIKINVLACCLSGVRVSEPHYETCEPSCVVFGHEIFHIKMQSHIIHKLCLNMSRSVLSKLGWRGRTSERRRELAGNKDFRPRSFRCGFPIVLWD